MPRGTYQASFRRGGAQLERRDADAPLASVGQEWFHSVSDRQRAISQLSAGFRTLATELATWYERHPDAPGSASSVQWLAVDVTPTLDEWNLFATKESGSWWVKAATKWDTFEDWHLRLKHLRELARAHGIVLQSAEPQPLPQTVWERSADGKGSETAAWFGVLKVAVAGAITITGAVALYSVLRDVAAARRGHAHDAQEPTARATRSP